MNRATTVRWASALLALVAAAAGLQNVQARPPRSNSSRILFWSGRSGFPSVWQMNADGSHPHELTRFAQNAKRGVLSPSGGRVAFDGAASGVAAMTNFDIQVMNIDGSRRVRLTTDVAKDIDPQWSPDGTTISYTHQRDNSGRQVSIWLIKPDGTSKRRLITGGEARWAPDGRRIVLTRWRGAQTDLFIYDLKSRRLSQLTSTPDYEEPGGWSADGQSIVFTRDNALGNTDVYTIDADGSDLRRLTSGPAEDSACSFSPDGRAILFTSNRTGHDQVFVMTIDGRNQHNVSRSTSDDEATQWHR